MSALLRYRMWLENVIFSDLGDISALPIPVQQYINSGYDEFAQAYLGWLRIQDGQSDAWLPEHAAFDYRLIAGMGHFFSDHQKLVARLDRVRTMVENLRSIDPHANPEAYNDWVERMLMESDERLTFNKVYEQLKSSLQGSDDEV